MIGPRFQAHHVPHLGWSWSVPGAAGIEDTREAAEAKIRKHQGRTP